MNMDILAMQYEVDFYFGAIIFSVLFLGNVLIYEYIHLDLQKVQRVGFRLEHVRTSAISLAWYLARWSKPNIVTCFCMVTSVTLSLSISVFFPRDLYVVLLALSLEGQASLTTCFSLKCVLYVAIRVNYTAPSRSSPWTKTSYTSLSRYSMIGARHIADQRA